MSNGVTTPPGITGTPPGSTIGGGLPKPNPLAPAEAISFPGFGQLPEMGPNWRIKFADADGIPLNMVSFEVIDFGAISFKEIFQNVKTILSTPLYSAALERLLGVDQTIVDLPVGQSADATVAIMNAIFYWESRCQPLDIQFDTDLISGRLGVRLQLNIQDVIYGTSQQYDRNNIFGTPTRVVQQPPKVSDAEISGPPGPAGAAGARGSLWFQGVGPPTVTGRTPMITVKRPVPGPPGPAGQRGFIWLTGTGDPITPQNLDMYLNTANGDVWQYDGATQTWRRTSA